MGTCQSASDAYTPMPSDKKTPSFTSITKHRFQLPPKINIKMQTRTSNGKITDYITKNGCPFEDALKQMDIKNNLDENHKFVDKKFPCNQTSIGKQPLSQTIQWGRPQVFMKGEYKIFEGKIQPIDIRQGKLGSCYLLSAVSGISQYPFIIERIFQTIQTSAEGVYAIWFFIDGIWKSVVVDDYFPLINNRPAFSRNNQNQLWVMLVEKAYAKTYGSYQAIQSGLTGIAMSNLTGAPYEYICKNSSNKIDGDIAWDFIKKNLAKNYIVCGSTQNSDRNAYMGLVSTHAYSILDAQQVFVSTKKGKSRERILKLSNPWGKYQWKGRWSEYSDVWSQELRNQLDCQVADDGIFWIEVEDFAINFGQICVCKYNKNYVSTSIILEFSENDFKGIFMHLPSHIEGYLSIIQEDYRKFGEGYEYSPVRIILMKLNNMNEMQEYISDLIDCDHDATMELKLEAGNYYILIQMDWKCVCPKRVVCNFYGEYPVNLEEDNKVIELNKIFNQIIILHQKFTQKQRIYSYVKDKNIVRITGSIAGYVYYHYKNQSINNNFLCQNVILKQRKFINVYKENLQDSFTIKVYPSEQRIVKLKATKQGNSFYSFSTKIQFYVVEKYSMEKLRELTDKKPTKMKKREIQGKQIDVRVKTYNYSGGIAILYQNKMQKYAYVQEIVFELQNLQLENESLPANNKLQIELEPQSQKLYSFIVISPGKDIVFRTKMSFYLNSPQFKF